MSTEEENNQAILEQEPENIAESGIELEVIEPQCYWCGKAQPEIKELLESKYQRKNQEEFEVFLSCTHEHASKTQEFFKYNEKFYFLYIAFMFIIPIILLALSLIIWNHIFSIGFSIFISLGLGLIVMPLLGNQMTKNLGLKRSNILGRIIGVILILIGVILILSFGYGLFR